MLYAAVAFFLFLTLSPSVVAQEYSLYGEVELSMYAARAGAIPGEAPEALAGAIPDASSIVGSAFLLRANHRLAYSWGDVVVRHRLAVPAGVAEREQLEHDLYHGALLMWPLERLTLQIGRHSIPLGMGQAFFPADALHRERLRTGEERGFDGLSTVWTFSPGWTLAAASRLDTAYGAADDPLTDLRWAAVLSGYLGRLDTMATVVYQPDHVLRPGAGFSLPLGGVIAHGEAAWEFETGDLVVDPAGVQAAGVPVAGTDGPAAAIGLHYTVYAGPGDTHAITAAVEYLYTEQTPGTHFLYPILSWDADQVWSADLSALIDLDTPEAIVRLEVARHFSDSLSMGFETLVSLDEGWEDAFPQGMVRLFGRAHF